MNRKLKKNRAVKVSVSLSPDHMAFLEANAALFGSTSAAVARGVEELMRSVAKNPEAFTIKAVLPKGAPKR